MVKLETVIKRSNNNFDLIRLLAALMVVFGHSFQLFRNDGYSEPVSHYFPDLNCGGLAVDIFFFLSGLFITASFVNSPSSRAFIIMRLFRIWPALIVCTIVTVFLVGPVVSKLTVFQYFNSKITWSYLFRNITLQNVRFFLPGVFDANHNPRTVNGPLWTLPVEVGCYFLIFVMGIMYVFKEKWFTILIFTTLILLYALNYEQLFIYWNKPVPFFFAGSLAFILRKHIVIDYKICLGLIALIFIHYNIILLYTAIIYAVLVIGSSGIVRKIKLPADYSYGIYIYGWLTQQVLSYYIPGITSCKSLLITIPGVFLIASLSWHFIEHPFLKMGKGIVDNPPQFVMIFKHKFRLNNKKLIT